MPRVLLTVFLLASAFYARLPASGEGFSEEEKAWWAVQPIGDPEVPASARAGHPIDAFVAERRRSAGLSPAPAAGPRELARRIFFGLHGLPPSPEEMNRFVGEWNEDADGAAATLVDQLLASKRYGERWGQHWLDLVRYAESDGYREDAFRPDAYRYRDYVIRAFNADKPYDQFVKEQLAADELYPDDPGVLEATGFLRLGVYEWNQRDAEMQREIMINEITNLTGEVFLGVGIGCARCHDHKFDPLLQRDYFALQAFLSSTVWPTGRKLGTPEQLRAHAEVVKRGEKIRAEIDQLLADRNRKGRDAMVKMFPENVQAMYRKAESERSPYEQQIAMLVERQVVREIAKTKPESALAKDREKLQRYKTLRAELAEIEASGPELPTAFISTDTGSTPAITKMKRGSAAVAVEPGFITLLGAPAPEIEPTPSTTGRRRALAEWIASTQNPLAARVIVNRVWKHHFGTGLAASTSDFGTLGEPPSHPELLDWLTSRFIEGGWRIKPLHRMIMTSETYRMTARHEPGEVEEVGDPANRLLWRFPPRRLSAEQIRDAMLTVSGEIKHRDGGGPSADGGAPVRSLYVKKKRNTPEPFLHSFDSPAGFDSAPERQDTTTPTQALLLANNEWPLARARAFAKRLGTGGKPIGVEAIRAAYELAWGRPADDLEIAAAQAFIEQQAKTHGEKSPPPVPAHKFPNETGLRPISQRFASLDVEEEKLGAQALWLQPGSRFEQLELKGDRPQGDTFSVEAVAQLDTIHKDARVNTIISRWNGDHSSPGWTLGVTSAKSRYEPRNLIVQLVGKNPGGDTEYEVVASGLRVPVGKAFKIGARIAPGKVTFTLDEQSATVEHNLVGGYQNSDTRLFLGGRDQKKPAHLWDGQLARAAIDGVEVIFDRDRLPAETAWLEQKLPVPTRADPQLEALTDFCHALLCSNEFLYLH